MHVIQRFSAANVGKVDYLVAKQQLEQTECAPSLREFLFLAAVIAVICLITVTVM
jgi:hypothetical protein